jgi:TRAP-type C4-dicarboxylate transport system permease small subunit
MGALWKAIKFADQSIEKMAVGLLVMALFGMLFLTLAVVALRWMQVTLLWMDPLIRHLVFLSTFLGGVVATGTKEHIGIDIVGKYFEGPRYANFNLWVSRVINLTCMGTLLWVIQSSLSFVRDTFKFEGISFLGIHQGVLVAIIPVGLGLMVYRFFYHFLASFSIFKNMDSAAQGGKNA